MNDADKKSSVGIVVLAAGASMRMGVPKQLLLFRGQTLLRRAVETAYTSVCRPVVVVLGAKADKVRREIEDLNVLIVKNQDWTKGMSSSIHVGINALAANAEVDAAALMLCDQPFITANAINRLVEAFYKTRRKLIVSEYNEICGVPALFDRALFPELLSLEGAGGAKQIINKHLDDSVSIAIPEAAIDIDTPQDFQHLNA